MDGGAEYRFIGTNAPFLERAWADPAEIEDEIRAASRSGIDVIRLYPFEVRMAGDPPGAFRHVMGPGLYDESAFKLFDKMLQLANAYGVRLIVPFVDSYNYVGGTPDWAAFRGKSADDFWTDPVIRQDFKDFIRFVLNRVNTYTQVPYKNDKAILAWQLGNELRSTDAWTSEMAAYVKSLDANHLVGDGGYVRAQGIRANALNDPNIDFIDPHIYLYHNYSDPIAKLNEWRTTTQGKKPLFIGEFGDFTPEVNERLLQTVQSNGTAGAMVWGSMSHHKMGGWHWPPVGDWSYLRYPGFPSGNWANETAIFNQLRQYAYAIKGIPVPAWTVPTAPILFPADSVHALSWLGASTSAAYDLERAASPSGPWSVVTADVTDDVTAPDDYNASVPIADDASALPGTSYYYRVKAKSPDGGYSPYSNVIGPIKPQEAIVADNGGSGYAETGTWGDSTLSGSYGGGSRYSNSAGSTATWTLEVGEPGYYNVYVRYPYHQTSSQSVAYAVRHNGVTDTIPAVNQTTITGQWRLIDTPYFAAGADQYVKLTAGTVAGSGNVTRADAVMLEPVAYGDRFQGTGTDGWTASGGAWSPAVDVAKTLLSQTLKQSARGIAETRAGDAYADVAVTASVKAYDRTDADSSSGLIARASADFSSYYTLRINYGQNKVQLYKKINGSWTKLGEAGLIASPGAWYQLRLELRGGSISGYVNGIRKLAVTDAGLTSGYAGLRTFEQTAVFDNFVVTVLD
ncbi:cellulase family glycosylhydrolase [Paenibacillus sacheonensis]|uniref:mannan endo-1,4-beta-mannosidase n=1 Tax=Paenibacillus sacheonensis TaxID=742054 RepID=A0A7X4YUF1_9BACL|nr:cellulase family glycosylhydrolase [Paenibacillus sacheonensis]NBC72732.1 cellulase family glycosylhydrolase [Paenibacillus sacheonensis]